MARPRGKRRMWWILGAVVAVVALGAGLFIAKGVASAAVTSKRCAEVKKLNVDRDDARPVSSGEQTVVILGDSYAQGQYLDDARGQAWSALIGEQSGWATYVNAIGGTGFTNGGRCGDGKFAGRVDAVNALNPDRVIIQTGLNEDLVQLARAAKPVIDSIAAPDIVIVGPVLAPGFDRTKTKLIDAALSDVATEAGVIYLSMLDLAPEYLPDGMHMTPAGHVQYAEHLAALLSTAH